MKKSPSSEASASSPTYSINEFVANEEEEIIIKFSEMHANDIENCKNTGLVPANHFL